MKKIVFAIAALAMFAACTKSQVLDSLEPESIGFKDSFIDNVTKTTDNSFSASNLPQSFLVYGTTKHGSNNAVSIFDAVEVSKSGEEYTYGQNYTQYWIKDNVYEFAALVNADKNKVTVTDLLPNSLVYTASYATDGSVADTPDLLYSTADATGLASNNPKVAFTFNHLLSNVKFTVKNTMTNNPADNLYEYEVTDIQIKNAYTSGKCTLSTKKWTEQATPDKVVKFGNVEPVGAAETRSASSDFARLLIPAKYQLNITCTMTTKLKGSIVNVENLTLYPTVDLEAGKAYNFVIEKDNPGEPIEFTVLTVNEWDPAVGGTDETIATL